MATDNNTICQGVCTAPQLCQESCVQNTLLMETSIPHRGPANPTESIAGMKALKRQSGEPGRQVRGRLGSHDLWRRRDGGRYYIWCIKQAQSVPKENTRDTQAHCLECTVCKYMHVQLGHKECEHAVHRPFYSVRYSVYDNCLAPLLQISSCPTPPSQVVLTILTIVVTSTYLCALIMKFLKSFKGQYW